jgi:hypothetical protein
MGSSELDGKVHHRSDHVVAFHCWIPRYSLTSLTNLTINGSLLSRGPFFDAVTE